MTSGLSTPLTVQPLTHDERVLALLADGQPHTHRELYALHVIAHSRVASLRKKGHNIVAWREGDSYLYQLLPTLEEVSCAAEGASADASSSGGSGSGTLTYPAPSWGTDGAQAAAAPIPGQLTLQVAV